MHDAGPSAPEAASSETRALAVKFVLGALGLFVIVAVLGHAFRAELEGLGRAILDRFGYAGISIGTYGADGFSFPIPPQFYMLASIAAGWSAPWTIVAVCIGSLLGGFTAYTIGRKASHLRLLQRLLARTQPRVEWLFARYGTWALAIGSLTPIPYSFLCFVAGAHRMQPRIYVLLSLFRIPKIVLYFYLVELAWRTSAG
jgi:membrane protein YqaA with SNARE-associated domain